MAIPGNLLPPTTESIDPNTSGWTAILNCSKSLGSGGRNGDGLLMLTSAAAGEMQAQTAAAYPVVAGTVYQTFGDASSSTQPERIGIAWYDDTLTVIGTTTWSATTTAASASLHRIGVAGAAPTGATQARVILSSTTTAAAAKSYFENVYLGPPIRTSGNLFPFNAELPWVDASGWAVDANAAITTEAPVTTWPVDFYIAGGEFLRATASAAGNMSVRTAAQYACQPGTEYRAYTYLSPPTSGAVCWVELRWYDATSTLISTKRAGLAQPGTGIYRQNVSGIAPTNAATCAVAAGITSATSGQVLRLQGAVLQTAPALLPGTVVPYEDASFEAGVGQWTIASGVATIARTTPWSPTTAYDGSYSALITSSTASASVVVSGRYPVTPGLNWRPAITVKPTTATTWSIATNVRWYDATSTSISVTALPTSAVPNNGDWWTVSTDTIAPAGAATARIEASLTPAAGSATLLMDSVTLVQALPDYDVEPDDTLGRVVITMRALDSSALLTLWRIVGGTQSLVRGPDGPMQNVQLSSSQLTVEDYEAPLGTPLTYRGVLTDPTTGAYRGDLTGLPITLDVTDPSMCWIKDPIEPWRNVLLGISAAPDWTRPIEQTEYRVRGRRNSVILSDVRAGLVGTFQVWTTTDDQRAALHFALDTGNPLLVQVPPGLGLDDMYVAVGEAGEPRFVPYGSEQRRLWQLPATQVDAPIGGVSGTAGWTVRDLATTMPTVTAVASSYATVLDLVLDQQGG